MIALQEPVNAWRLAAATRRLCPRCHKPMIRHAPPHQHARIATINHKLPKVRGGADVIHGGARNWELMCSECNGFLARCGHCPGVAIALEVVARALRMDRETLAKQWRIPQRAAMADDAFGSAMVPRLKWALKDSLRREEARKGERMTEKNSSDRAAMRAKVLQQVSDDMQAQADRRLLLGSFSPDAKTTTSLRMVMPADAPSFEALWSNLDRSGWASDPRPTPPRVFVCQGCGAVGSVIQGASMKCGCGVISAAELLP